MKFAIIRTGGKQYLVSESDEIVVDHLKSEKDVAVEFETLAEGDFEKNTVKLGKPALTTKVKGKVLENLRGDKIRVARFKEKTRQRKVRGFRAMLTRVKIVSI